MASRDLRNNIVTVSSLTPAARTAAANGAAVDLAGYESAVFVIHPGTITDGTHVITAEESDASGSGFATVAAGDLSGSFTSLTSSTVAGTMQEVGYLGQKRYVRLVTTPSGTTTGGVYSGVVVKGHSRHKPN